VRRFFVRNIAGRKEVRIEGAEAHHILSVFRLRKDDRIILFDGSGFEYDGVIKSLERKALEVEIISGREVDREPSASVTLALSPAKSKRMDFAIQKCAELGLKTLIPLEAERTVVRIKQKRFSRTERWQRIAAEASKQSGRNRILEIKKLQAFDRIISSFRDYDLRLIASPSEDAAPLVQVLKAHPGARRIICMIGPEGGFTDKELKLAAANSWESVSLGKSILRVETAAVAALAMILYEYDVGK